MEGSPGKEGTVVPGPSTDDHIEYLDDKEPKLKVPEVVIEPSGQSRFASSVLKVLSMQRFSRKTRKSRDSFLEKYTYLPTYDGWNWRRKLFRRSASAVSQVQSPSSDATSGSFDGADVLLDADAPHNLCFRCVFDPSGSAYFFWLFIVVLGVLYNYWMLIFRVAFFTLKEDHLTTFLVLDYVFYLVFLLDIVVQLRTGFFVNGYIVTDSAQLAKHYVKSVGFFLDIIAILPVDLFYFLVGPRPFLRFGRLLKVNRFFLFCDRAEFYSERPKLFNLFKQVHYLVLILHWVACMFFMISHLKGFGTDGWVHPRLEDQWSQVSLQYVYCLYRSIVSMTTVGTGISIGAPQTTLTIAFVIFTYLCGVLIFASIVGNAGDMIVHMRRSREQYLRKLDGMKAYIAANQLPVDIQRRVVQWFDYLWTYKKDMNEQELFQQLNHNFKTEIAIHVNLDMLKKVKMFERCDPGFLRELVLMLKPLLCSPGDYVCRQDEIGKEMFFVKKGELEVVDENKRVLATLSAGRHFGEISILDMDGIGNRRTASVRSVGFTDLFRLSKADLEEVLQHYSQSREQLHKIARQTYENQQRARKAGEEKCEEPTDLECPSDSSTSLEMDPRRWLTADRATLQRRLSDIEAQKDVQMLANEFKREHGMTTDAQELVAEFARLAREERSDEESRRMIDEFLAIHRESVQSRKEQRCSHESVAPAKCPHQTDKQQRSDQATNLSLESTLKSSVEVNSDFEPQKQKKVFGRARPRTATTPGLRDNADVPLLKSKHSEPSKYSIPSRRRGAASNEPMLRLKPLSYSRVYRSSEFPLSTGTGSQRSDLNSSKPTSNKHDQGIKQTPHTPPHICVRMEPELPLSEQTGRASEYLCAEESAHDTDSIATPRKISGDSLRSSTEEHSICEGHSPEKTDIDDEERPKAAVSHNKVTEEGIAQGNELQRTDQTAALLPWKAQEECRITTL